MDGDPLTVDELIAALQRLPPEQRALPVFFSPDEIEAFRVGSVAFRARHVRALGDAMYPGTMLEDGMVLMP